MLRSISILIFIFSTITPSWSQQKVTIRKNKKNAALFDEVSPTSMLSLMKNSFENLGYFHLEGMDETLIASLSSHEKSKLIAFSTNDLTPLYNEYGEEMVEYDSVSGSYVLLYAYPDTIYASLDQIEQLVIHVKAGKGSIFGRMERIEFWRKYNGELHRTLSVDADILKFKGFKYVEPVDEGIAQKWTDSLGGNSLWMQMRKAAMETADRRGSIDEVDDQHDFWMSFFPTHYDFSFFYFITSSLEKMEKALDEEAQLYVRNFYKTDFLPFAFNYGDTLSIDTNMRIPLEQKFTSISSYWNIPTEPIIDGDPDSPNFMEPLIQINDDGTMEFVYEDPILNYVWLEYEPLRFYAVKEISEEEMDQGPVSRIVGLICTQEQANEKPELVSYSPVHVLFQDHFSSYPITRLVDLPWFSVLKKEAERKKNARK